MERIMQKPEGSLTSVQHEILTVVWESGDQGATISEVWQAVSAQRRVGRTTILNLVDRLEKRGWLVRCDSEKPCRYLAALSREDTAVFLAGGFVDDFFAGSASNLVMSLLGSKRLKPEELGRLRQLLESTSKSSREKKRK
jgi:BlaI family transcriptional regulator, penicillinase repressor